eukprot:evm.model.scf_1435.1 EVM.evm.TU.scf_1435.1   scf_1435:7254-16830(-)
MCRWLQPEGYGRYVWTDGSTYEGQWKGGTKHGNGNYVWPSGAQYTGEWSNGCMQGYGTFKAADGSRYQGGWANDLKHGLGKKFYSNGDKYDGLWKHGKPDGPGRYVWADGNEYNGEWKNGRMHGHGTFQWKTGERYDGEWKDGREDGLGTFQWKDNSTYDGLWQVGKKHGIGLFRPSHSDSRRSISPLVPSISQHSDGTESQLECSTGDDLSEGPLTAPAVARKGGQVADQGLAMLASESIFLREYEHGRLAFEAPVSLEDRSDMELLFAVLRLEEPGRLKKLLLKAGEKDKGPGEIIYKEHRSYNIMVNLQLGIQYSVGKINTVRLHDGLKEHHFYEKVKLTFPRRGSKQTPPHMSNDFKWKDYAPMIFRKLRENFGIDPADYLMSLCGNNALRELPSPGKSGALFYLSHDNRFIIKTMKKTEMKHLFAMLRKYYSHMEQHQHSLITKFYGLHRVTPYKGPKIRFVVMGNLFRTDLPIHRRYDLKGSTHGRFTKQDLEKRATMTLKDLDLEYTLKLEEGWHERLHRQLTQDCKLLRSMSVMDYSLLLGVHFRKTGVKEMSPSLSETESDVEMEKQLQRFRQQIYRMKLDERHSQELLKLVEMKMESRKTKRNAPQQVLARQPLRNDTLRPVAYSDGGTDALAFFLNYDHVQLGKNMAATAVQHDPKGNAADTAEDVVVYFGIIDILQEYNIIKRLEHRFKSLAHDGKTISAVDPNAYAERFMRFMRRVFQ